MTSSLTPLERACVELVAASNWPDFQYEGLRVLRREKTGVGCYVYLDDSLEQEFADGTYGPEPGRAVQMVGVRHGLDFAIDVSGGRIKYLELVTAGDDGWDGEEREWRLA